MRLSELPNCNHWHCWEVWGLGFTFTPMYLILAHSLADLHGFQSTSPQEFLIYDYASMALCCDSINFGLFDEWSLLNL